PKAGEADEVAHAAGSDAEPAAQVAPVLSRRWTAFENEDATWVEVNPLVKPGAGDILALDGKVSLDDNADFRRTKHEELRDISAENPLELKAKKLDLTYGTLDGEAGIIGNGAGRLSSPLAV